jgi:simple sugar transport system permease protein
MNSVAQLFCNYLSAYPFKGELPISATKMVGSNAFLPKLAGNMNDLNFGFIIAILLAIVIYVALFKTRFGYESRAAGISRIFSRYIGVNAARTTIVIVMMSGAIAGLAGAERILGVSHRYIADFSNGVGYTGIAVSLLAMHNPIGCVVAAIFFGALENGAIQMEVMTNISRDLVTSIEAIMIIFMAGSYSFPRLKKFLDNRKKVVVDA